MITKQELIYMVDSYKNEIIKDAESGNEVALDLVIYYNMWYACPGDDMCYVLVEAKYKEWTTCKV